MLANDLHVSWFSAISEQARLVRGWLPKNIFCVSLTRTQILTGRMWVASTCVIQTRIFIKGEAVAGIS